MSAIQQLRARYSAKESRSKTFFEGENAIEISCAPITVFESDKIKKLSKGSDFLYCVELIYLKALDSKGDRLFPTMVEKQLLLKNVLADDVAEIATWISSSDEIEDDEKN